MSRFLEYVFPKILTLPAVIGTNPITALIRVDLPAPFGPTIAIICPLGKLRSIFHNAGSVRYVTERFLIITEYSFSDSEFFLLDFCSIISKPLQLYQYYE